MKKILTALLLCVITLTMSTSAIAQKNEGVNFFHGTFEEALAKVKKAGKKSPQLIFVDCYTQWCGPCKYMANTLFPTKTAGDYFNSKFITIKMDMETPEGIEFGKKFPSAGYPTFYVIDKSGEAVNFIVGSSNKIEDFIARVEECCDVTKSPNHLLKAFNQNRTKTNAVNYVKALYGANKYDKSVAIFLEKNLDLFTERDIFSYELWPLFEASINWLNMNNTIAEKIYNNMAASTYSFSNPLVKEKLAKYYNSRLLAYLKGTIKLTDAEAAITADRMYSLSVIRSYTFDEIICNIYRQRVKGDYDSELEIIKDPSTARMFSEGNYVNDLVQIVSNNPKCTKEMRANFLDMCIAEFEKTSKRTISDLNRMKDDMLK